MTRLTAFLATHTALALWIGAALPLLVLPSPKIAAFVVAVSVALAVLARLVTHGLRGLAPLRRPSALIGIAILALSGLSLASALWSPDPLFTVERAGQFSGGLLVAALFYAYAPEGLGRTAAPILAIAVPFSFVIIVLDWVMGHPIVAAVGMDAHPQEYNRPLLHLALLIAVVLAAGVSRPLMVVNVAVLVGTVVLTESQATQVGFLAALLLAAIAWFAPRLAFGLAVAGLAVAVFAVPFILGPLSEWAGRSLGETMPTSAAIRIEIWSYMTERLGAVMPLGFGFEATRFGPEIGNVRLANGVDWPLQTPFHPHNFALQTLYELGVIGSIIVFAIGCAVVMKAYTWPPRILAPALFTLAMIVVSASLASSAWQPWRIGLIALLIVLFADLARKDYSANTTTGTR